MDDRYFTPPIPNGWFQIAYADEIKPLVDQYIADIVHNTIHYNSEFGILLQKDSNPTIYDNELFYNGNNDENTGAIYLDGSSGGCNAKVVSNDISNNTGTGIRIKSSSPMIEGNDINYNMKGVFFQSCTGTVKGNAIGYNTDTGVTVEQTSGYSTIEANVFNYNDIGLEISESRVGLPKRCEVTEDFAKHCHNVAKRLGEDEETGSERYVYVKLGPDHFRHALNYECIARSYGQGGAFQGAGDW